MASKVNPAQTAGPERRMARRPGASLGTSTVVTAKLTLLIDNILLTLVPIRLVATALNGFARPIVLAATFALGAVCLPAQESANLAQQDGILVPMEFDSIERPLAEVSLPELVVGAMSADLLAAEREQVSDERDEAPILEVPQQDTAEPAVLEEAPRLDWSDEDSTPAADALSRDAPAREFTSESDEEPTPFVAEPGIPAESSASDQQAAPLESVPISGTGDEIFLVSTRKMRAQTACADFGRLVEVYRYCDRRWERSSLEAITQSARPDALTLVWCHGNRFSFDDSKSYGLAVFKSLCRCQQRLPLRLVVWSWPSDRVAGPLRDARIKGSRALCEGERLAWFLKQLPVEDKLALMGYSYGTRVISEGANRYLMECQAEGLSRSGSLRMVLLAPAMDQAWLAPNGRFCYVLQGVEKLAVLYNSRDVVLKRYRFLYRRGNRAEALGFRGALPSVRAALGRAFSEWDVTSWLQREHNVLSYLHQPQIQRRICQTLFCP